MNVSINKMNNLSQILIRPIVTEKMTLLQDQGNKYAFEVPLSANKIEIKKIVRNNSGIISYCFVLKLTK